MNSLIAVVFVVVFFSLLWLAIRTARRQAEQRQTMNREMGFTKVEPPPTDFVARLQALKGNSRQKIVVRNLSIRGCGRYDLYVFDMITSNSSDTREPAAAIVSHDLNLPAFHVFPAMPFSGKIANWLNQLTSYMATQSGYVPYPAINSIRFTQRYRLYVADEREIPRCIPEEVWGKLAEIEPPVSIHAQGDILLFQEISTKPTSFRSSDPDKYRSYLRSLIDQGGRLHSVFCETNQLEAVR